MKKLLVAWDGSREASRALAAAISAFPDVRSIDLVTVSGNEESAQDISRHLSRHDKEVKMHLVPGDQTNAGQVLLEQVNYLGSDLLVMGAYGHSRLREFVVGGATRHVLENTDIPVYFCH